MTDKERIKQLEKDLALCRKTVEKLTKEKSILESELFTVDPNNEVLKGMRGDEN
jgi:predicted RNase H-like nuclease (RuvC/YqgF family)